MKQTTVHLRPTATHQIRVVSFLPVSRTVPVAGVVSVWEQAKPHGKFTDSRYAVREQPDPDHPRNRRFRLTKPGGLEPYWLEVCPNPAADLCQCTGFLQYGRCKHLEAVRALVLVEFAEGEFRWQELPVITAVPRFATAIHGTPP